MSIQTPLRIVAALVMAAVFALPVVPAAAQPQPAFKAGDRVEVDTIEASSPSRAIWKKGVVLKVDLTSMAYIIQLDPLPGQLPKTMAIPIRPYAAGWIHPAGGAAPHVAADRLRVDANGTVLADRPLLPCDQIVQPPARNGQPLPVALARTLIRCLYEKAPVPGSDGATTMDVVQFVPGPPHRWNKNVDSGAGGTIDTVVFPVRVTWNQKTFYRTYDETQTSNARVFTCYVDVDKWFCGSAQFIRDGAKRQIPVAS
jgi:hypothetical protein